MSEAMRRSAPLAHLRAMLEASRECMEAVRPLLPPALAAQMRPGPIDESGAFVILVSSPAVAAKLRQLQPRLEKALAERGRQSGAIRVRVQAG
ncbi:DciA family protein [Caldimonas sp. KR1-144]|uniref:DciA family protein n=1 Tax=Caldimonas sp. KR1-144 TaxID=3400911 RepID=UPI003C0FA638